MTDLSYKHIFGPVPSRRLGMSLGIDLVPPKTCSLNCIYCECGRTTQWTVLRKEYVPTDAVISELNHFLQSKPDLDYITFSGAGEPTLHSGIGIIADYLKTTFPQYKTALLTNGTLFYRPGLIEEVQAIDVIIPSLDAASEDVFKQLNRPHPALNVAAVVDGLVELRKNYSGQIWLEIFIVPGLNDTDAEIENLRTAIRRIEPDRIQLNTLDRPGTVSWVKPATKDSLEKIAKKLAEQVEVIARFKKREQVVGYNVDVESVILQTIKRRPCTAEDLSSILGLHQNEINKYIEPLLRRKLIRSEILQRGIFFRVNT